MSGHVDVAQTGCQGENSRRRVGSAEEGEAMKGTKPLPSRLGVGVEVLGELFM